MKTKKVYSGEINGLYCVAELGGWSNLIALHSDCIRWMIGTTFDMCDLVTVLLTHSLDKNSANPSKISWFERGVRS